MPDANTDNKNSSDFSCTVAAFPLPRLLRRRGSFSYRTTLFFADLLAVLLIFRISAQALDPELFLHLRLKQGLALLVFPILLIAFFTNFNLYDYYQSRVKSRRRVKTASR